MNKNQLVKSISRRINVTQKECALWLCALKDVLEETLCRGEEVSLSGFGRFLVKFKAERQGVHPSTGQKVIFPSKYVPIFCPSAQFKDKFR
ncbi:MAG: HU family DNA-binding protein [Clostridia bacterium]|nr:HU family DNA-binding protein [Clostridia bacterium]